jgi:hypothetical protein
MVDIAMDLRLQGNLDLRVAGWISLLGNEEDRRQALGDDYGREHRAPRRSLDDASSATRRQLSSIGREAAQLLEDEDDGTRAWSRAISETREAIRAMKEAMESDDAQRVQHARGRLKQAAARVADLRRRSEAKDVADAELVEGA